MSSPTILLVSGSLGIWPETKMKPPARMPGEYAPAGAAIAPPNCTGCHCRSSRFIYDLPGDVVVRSVWSLMPQRLADRETPTAVVYLDRLARNLDRAASYATAHGLSLR